MSDNVVEFPRKLREIPIMECAYCDEDENIMFVAGREGLYCMACMTVNSWDEILATLEEFPGEL